MTTFAVVIPLHNKGPHIDRALASVLRQTLPPDEILIVDDASTDDGLTRVLSYKDPRLRIIRRPVPGPGGYAARNLAVLEAQSDWVAFLDADDEWLPTHLESLSNAAAAEGRATCVFSGYTNIHPDGRQEIDRFSLQAGRNQLTTYALDEFLKAWLAIGECPIWTSASAFQRTHLVRSGLFPAGRCSRGGDKDLWLRAAREGLSVAAPSVTAIYHRDSVNMVTRTRSTTGRHCICNTIVGMLDSAPVATRPLLRRLFNQEVYQYALFAAKSGSVQLDAWQGFYKRDNPIRFAILAGLSTTTGAYTARQLRKLRGRL